MKRWAKILGLVAVAAVVAAAACSTNQPIKSQIVHNAHTGKSLLIASVSSEFKDALVSRIIDNYKGRADIRLVNLDKLKVTDLSHYDALVVVDARTGWMMFNTKVRRTVRKMADKNKLVLVLTGRKHQWSWKKGKVDAITCASVKDHADPVYRNVVKKLDRLLGSR